MNCVLKKTLKVEHDRMRDPRLGEILFQCPLIDKQICYWCCLHIYDAAQPVTRVSATDSNPAYAGKIISLSGREDLDAVWATCSKCGRRA